MKILYVCERDLQDKTGVSKKIVDQASLWKKLGHEVDLYSIYSHTWQTLDSFVSTASGEKYRYGVFGRGLNLKDALKEGDWDIVYLRYHFYVPFLKQALKRFKVVMEINADDREEYDLSGRSFGVYNRATRNLVLDIPDGFVFVTEELRDRFKHEARSLVLGNGISVPDPLNIQNEGQRPKAAFIGTLKQPWQGTDILLKIAQQIPECDFHIIGGEGDSKANIFYHGFMSEPEDLLSGCDVGFGTLAWIRKGLKDACTLKVREYLSLGLPVVYAYNEVDLSGEEPFALKLGHYEEDILSSIEEIKAFLHKAHMNNELRRQAHEFAKNNLDVSVKEKKRLEFMESLL
ncbi:glycosyltransferase [Limisalsivibrio acetivorans]|uniref:glycosyltransferase n=1 Tax=Limisalsivibrio acetivorans TaxID=1304888 RepID=UPI0003B3047E|nr:glycosyltransferase [Limisalsivibrio acetivorans]